MHDVRVTSVRRLRSSRRLLVVPASVRARTAPIGGLVITAVAVLLALTLPKAIGLPVAAAALIAAAVLLRHVFGDLAAGLTLLLAQPYAVGEQVRLSVGGAEPVDAEVLQVRLTRTTLCSPDGVLVVRNRHMLHTTAA